MPRGVCCAWTIIMLVMAEKGHSPSAIRHLHLHISGGSSDIKPFLTESALEKTGSEREWRLRSASPSYIPCYISLSEQTAIRLRTGDRLTGTRHQPAKRTSYSHENSIKSRGGQKQALVPPDLSKPAPRREKEGRGGEGRVPTISECRNEQEVTY